MPEERLIKAAEVSVFAHATEDEEKVKQAVKRLAKYEPLFESQRLTGHYEDPITLLTSKTVKKKEATDFLANIINKLSSLDKETLLQELPNRVDPQGSLYIRLDKQKAFHGRAVLAENDPIRVKFKFQLPHKADPVAVVREYIINLEEDEE
ncbi:MAG: exosome subunit [Candidatus Bathyarchaeota archaeon]|nr:exosome subunit [Candidatus Bathyarchaeota archaeon]